MRSTLAWPKALVLISAALLLVGGGLFLSGSGLAKSKTEELSSTDPLHPIETFRADSRAKTIIDAFRQAGVDYYPEDKVSAFPDPALGLGTVVTVERALPIVVQDGKHRYVYRTWQATVGEMLGEKKILLGDEDRLAPSPSTKLDNGMQIIITRVERTEISEFETIFYETLERQDNTMWRGETKVAQVGVNGRREKRYQLIREDGELVSKTLLSNSIIEPPVNKVVLIGTKLKIGRVQSGEATWYPFPNRWGTKVAVDFVPRGREVRVTNIANGRSIIVRNEGCICGNGSAVIDLAPEYFLALGGTLGQGRISHVRVEEILP